MPRSKTTTEIRAELAQAREKLATLEKRLEAARVASDRATPWGLRGDWDPAVLSGIRRKPNPRADARRWDAYDRELDAIKVVHRQVEEVKRLEWRLKTAERNEKAAATLVNLPNAKYVRNKYGWHEVVRVNAKTVTVKTGYSWNDRIARDKILECR